MGLLDQAGEENNMSINLSRNTKLYVSTVKDTDVAGHSTATTFEVPVLDGYSFSQEADTQTITLNEAGDAPVRGQKIFNTALTPGDVSFTTYVRPYTNSGTDHDCIEKVLWEALVGDGTGGAVTAATVGTNAKPGASYLEATFENSDKHELLNLYLFFAIDNAVYRLNEFSVNSAEIDFSIDGIASIAWSGQCNTIEELGTTDGALRTEFDAWVSNTDYVAALAINTGGTEALFIKNKLSSLSVVGTSDDIEAVWTVDYGTNLNGLDNNDILDVLTYTFDITVDGGTLQTISIDGSAEPWLNDDTTVQDVIDEINVQLDGATCSILDGDLIFTSHTAGTASTVLVALGAINDLLAALEAAFVGLGTETTICLLLVVL